KSIDGQPRPDRLLASLISKSQGSGNRAAVTTFTGVIVLVRCLNVQHLFQAVNEQLATEKRKEEQNV
ncbi:unnamed protein product, partial [Heterotrigona itama]